MSKRKKPDAFARIAAMLAGEVVPVPKAWPKRMTRRVCISPGKRFSTF